MLWRKLSPGAGDGPRELALWPPMVPTFGEPDVGSSGARLGLRAALFKPVPPSDKEPGSRGLALRKAAVFALADEGGPQSAGTNKGELETPDIGPILTDGLAGRDDLQRPWKGVGEVKLRTGMGVRVKDGG